MTIGLDAKRAFTNNTGLGNYSRTLIDSLATFYPQHRYLLFTPKPGDLYRPERDNISTITPTGFPSAILPSAWRSSWVKKDLRTLGVDLYHGLSHEIPIGIQHTGIHSVVTIHDLIFERYPKQYSPIDVRIYRKKFINACQHSDHVIAISEQTKADIIQFYGIDPHKITVCYQSCDPAFSRRVSEEEKLRVKERYALPDQFFLSVGSVIERKNLLTIVKAYAQYPSIDIPLVVIGTGDDYEKKVLAFVEANSLQQKVIFLSRTKAVQQAGARFHSVLPAIYQQAVAMIYPSIFEGFGIPILEALYSELPVITSNVSCMPETGGNAAVYVDPFSVEQMADAMIRLLTDYSLRADMKQKGLEHATRFTPQQCAATVMDVYQKVVNKPH